MAPGPTIEELAPELEDDPTSCRLSILDKEQVTPGADDSLSDDDVEVISSDDSLLSMSPDTLQVHMWLAMHEECREN